MPGFLCPIKYELLDLLKSIGPDKWIAYTSAFSRFKKVRSPEHE